MAVCPDFTLQTMMRSSGWQTLEGEPTCKRTVEAYKESVFKENFIDDVNAL